MFFEKSFDMNLVKKLAIVGISSVMMTQPNYALAANAAEELPEKVEHKTTFDVRFGKVSVGVMSFAVSSDYKTYTVKGSGRTKGLAEWFAAGKARLSSSGDLTDRSVLAKKHFITVSDKKKTATLNMNFSKGQLTDLEAKPDKSKKHLKKKYITITPEHMTDLIDPASTLVIPVPYEKANDARSVCNKTHRVYDGETRYDMKLSYKKTAAIKTKGYNGNAYVCRLNYIPVSGHKPGNKNAKRMAANNNMEIWLAPMQKSNLFTPIRIKVPTWIGNFYADASYFGPS